MLPVQIVYLAAFIDLCGAVNYAYATANGQTQPNRITWFIGMLVPFVAAAAQISRGVGLSTLFVIACGTGPLIIFLCSFVNKKSYWRIDAIDYACGGLALTGLIAWQVTSNPNIGIIFSIAADFFAMAPTIRKAITTPESENKRSALIFVIAAALGLLSIQQATFAAIGFNAYILGMDLLILFLLNRRSASAWLGARP